MLLTHNLADVGYVVLRCHKVGEVVHAQFIHTCRDNRLSATLDGYDVIRIVGAAKVSQRQIQNLGRLTQFNTQQNQGSIMHIPTLTYPRHLQSVVDVGGSKHFGIDKRVEP